MPRFALWGALGGLLLSLLPAATVATGLATVAEGATVGVCQLTAIVSGPLALLSAGSAAGSLALARGAQEGDSLQAGVEGARLGRGN